MAHAVEEAIQAELVRMARVRGLFVFHCPNGGQRSAREGAAFKRIGVVAGIPDLIFALKDGRTVFVEVKTQKGTLSDAQKAVHAELERLGHQVFTAYGGPQGVELIERMAEGKI